LTVDLRTKIEATLLRNQKYNDLISKISNMVNEIYKQLNTSVLVSCLWQRFASYF